MTMKTRQKLQVTKHLVVSKHLLVLSKHHLVVSKHHLVVSKHHLVVSKHHLVISFKNNLRLQKQTETCTIKYTTVRIYVQIKQIIQRKALIMF